MFKNGKTPVLYRIQGRELEAMRAAQARAAQVQAAFYELATFIGQREGLDLNSVIFDPDAMVFTRRPVVSEVAPAHEVPGAQRS